MTMLELGVRFTNRAELYPLLEPLGISTVGEQAFSEMRMAAVAAVESRDRIFMSNMEVVMLAVI